MVRPAPGSIETNREIKKMFYKFDRKKKGYINFNDLKKAARTLGEDITEEKLK